MEVKNTSTVKPNICCLIVGQSSSGKTTLAGTLKGKTLVVSAEAGLLSLKDKAVDFVEVAGADDVAKWEHFRKCLIFAVNSDYDNIFIDSLSEISDYILALADKEFPEAKNTMQKWGYYSATMKKFIRFIRDIPKNVFMTTLQKTDKDEVGKRYYAPDVSGKMTEKMPAYFDLVLNMKILTKDDEQIRVLQTFSDSGVVCKDRSGKLNRYEKPDLSLILDKINGGINEIKNGKSDNGNDKKGTRQVSKSV